ncbi:MAG: hypothetical protein R3Y16_04185 [Rikenellaceae bacterium]
MGAFTPFKRHANKFNYTPRTYDPAKEAREQRREELFGRRSDQDEGGEGYRPGQFIRRSRAARSSRYSTEGRNKKSRSSRMWILIGAIVAVTYMGSMLYSKLIGAFGLSEDGAQRTEQTWDPEEFNPYTPITIVPNDYVEE